MTLLLHLHILMKSVIHSEENQKFMTLKHRMMVLMKEMIQRLTQNVVILSNAIKETKK